MAKNGCVTIGNTEMYYMKAGKGNKNLVVLPGLSDGLTTVKGKAWVLSLPYRKFFQEYTVYLFSRKNDMPEGYTIRDMANDQVLALQRLGIQEIDLLGVSQGGMIAQYIAIDHPEMVKKLVLAFTTPYANDVVKEAVLVWVGMAKKNDHRALMVDTAERTYSEAYLQKNRKLFPLLAKVTKPKSYDRFLRNAEAILSFDCREELSKIKCPVYILAGSEDHTVGTSAAMEFKEAIKDSELYVYEGLGHGAYEEADDFYDKVYRFCSNDKEITES